MSSRFDYGASSSPPTGIKPRRLSDWIRGRNSLVWPHRWTSSPSMDPRAGVQAKSENTHAPVRVRLLDAYSHADPVSSVRVWRFHQERDARPHVAAEGNGRGPDP